MPDGVLAPGVLAPMARYPNRFDWVWPEDAAFGIRCPECEHMFRRGDAVVMAGHRWPIGGQWMHRDCWERGAPWRQAAAERAKAGAR